MKNNNSTNLTPKQIVDNLDQFIVGQFQAKKSVAIALRNRYRRMQLNEELIDEVLPKNILMIGSTGVGKTEIARRLAKLSNAPFIKVEATKFTEIGYVGRDVEQIIRDLIEISVNFQKEDQKSKNNIKALKLAKDKVVAILVGEHASEETKQKFYDKLESGSLNDSVIDIEVSDNSSKSSSFEIPGMPNASIGMINLGDILGKTFNKTKTKNVRVKDAINLLLAEELEKLLDNDLAIEKAIKAVEQNGIVFIDEIDKICSRQDSRNGDVSREGVQRDLLPLIEGTSVNTKYGTIKTDHILFITSGAFHLAKPSDLLPELQGRLPIRVELQSLSAKDFEKILTEPSNNIIKQSIELLKVDGVNLTFTKCAIEEIAKMADEINSQVENIGARRLHTLVEKILEEISFEAPYKNTKKININSAFVKEKLENIVKNQDMSRYIL